MDYECREDVGAVGLMIGFADLPWPGDKSHFSVSQCVIENIVLETPFIFHNATIYRRADNLPEDRQVQFLILSV